MSKYNLIIKGNVVNTIEADENFINLIKNDYDEIELVDSTLVDPNIPTPAVIPDLRKVVSPIEFKMLFTSTERIAINQAKSTDNIVQDFFSIIDDPRLTSVDLNLKSVQDGLDYLVSKKLINSDRKEKILSGIIE